MDARVNDIVTQVRENLNEIGIQNIKNLDIYRKGRRVEQDIINELKPIERSVEILTVADQEDYDFLDAASIDIKLFKTSWDEDIELKSNLKFQEISTTGYQYPQYATIFNRIISFRPIPANDDDIITVWCYQTEPILNIEDNIAPEIPKYLDDALILGICAQYDFDKFGQRYEYEKMKYHGKIHKKHSNARVKDSNW